MGSDSGDSSGVVGGKLTPCMSLRTLGQPGL